MTRNRLREARSRSVSAADQPAAGSRSWLSGRWGFVCAAGLVAVGAGVYTGASQVRHAAYAARLPSLPELSGQPAAVGERLVALDRSARAQPTSIDAVGALGLAYHADMFYGQAERVYAITEDLSGFAWRWTYYRALARGMRGDIGGLAEGLRQVVAAAPDFGPAWWRLGEAEFKAGHYERADDAWRHALPLGEPVGSAGQAAPARVPSAPVSAYATLGLARLAMMRGETDRAGALLEDITVEAPSFGPAFRLLGDVYATLDRVQDAERATRVANGLAPYEPYLDPLTEALVHESRSTTFLLQQAATVDLNTNAAWREYLVRRALKFDPDHVEALYDLATMFRLLRRYDEALVLLERLRRRRPDDFQLFADMGQCLWGLRRYAEAEEILRRALDGLDNADVHNGLGLVLNQVGRLREAVVEYRRALDRNPNHLGALNNLGAALVSQDQLDEAMGQFDRLVALDPGDPDAQTSLGVVFSRVGSYEQAVGAFQEALRIDPDHEDARARLREIELR